MNASSPLVSALLLLLVVGATALPLDLASNDRSERPLRWSSPFSEQELRSAHEAQQEATIAKWSSENEWIHEEDFLTPDAGEFGSPALVELGLAHARCSVVSRGKTFTGMCLDPEANHELFLTCDSGFVAQFDQQSGCRAGTLCCIRQTCSIPDSSEKNRACYKDSVCKEAGGTPFASSEGARGCGSFADDVKCCDFKKPITQVCEEYVPDREVNALSDRTGSRLKYLLDKHYHKTHASEFCNPYAQEPSYLVYQSEFVLRRCNSHLPAEWSARLRAFLFYKHRYCDAVAKGNANPYYIETRSGAVTLSFFESIYKHHQSDEYKNRVSKIEKLMYGENGRQPKPTEGQIKDSLHQMLTSSSKFKDFDGAAITKWDASTGQSISGKFVIPTPIAAVTVEISADAGYLQGTSGSRVWGSLALRIRVGCEAAYAFINVQLSGAVNSPSFHTFPELLDAIWFYFYSTNEDNVKVEIEKEIEAAYSGQSKSPTMQKIMLARLVIVKYSENFSKEINGKLDAWLVDFDVQLGKVLAWGTASACGDGNAAVIRQVLFTDERVDAIIARYEEFADEAEKSIEEWYPSLFPAHLSHVRDMVTKTFKEKIDESVRKDMKGIKEDLAALRELFRKVGMHMALGLTCPMTGYQLESKLRSIRDRLVKVLKFDNSRHLMVRSWVDTLKLGVVAVVKEEMGKYDDHVAKMRSKWFKTEWIVDVSIGVSVDFEKLFSFLVPAKEEKVFEIAGIAGHKEEQQIYPYRVEQPPVTVINSLGMYGSGQLTSNFNLRVEYRCETYEHLLNVQLQYKVSDMAAMKDMLAMLYTSLEGFAHMRKSYQNTAGVISKTAGHTLVNGVREYFSKKTGEWIKRDRSRTLARDYIAKAELELKWGGSDGFYVNKAIVGYDDTYTLTIGSAKTKKLFGKLGFEGSWTSSVEFSYRTYQSF